MDDDAAKSSFIGVAANTTNEANVRLVDVAGLGIDSLKAASKTRVVELEATTRLVGRKLGAVAAEIVWITRTLRLTCAADGTLLSSVRRLAAWLEERHYSGDACAVAERPQAQRLRSAARWLPGGRHERRPEEKAGETKETGGA